MRRLSLGAAGAALAILLPAAAQAATGVTTSGVNMRAGPDTAYPVVTTVPAGAPVQIYGCLADRSWCDTLWVGQRGWVSASYLNVTWRGAPAPVVTYAPKVAVPVVTYNQATYWNAYYAGRPWYRTRQVYVGPNHQCFRGPRAVACR